MLSMETGGMAFFPRSMEQVDDIAAEVARDIRSQYTINYRSTKPMSVPGFRRIEVVARTGQPQAQRPHPHRLLPISKPPQPGARTTKQ